MTVQPYRLYIERIDPSKNMARFYALSIEPNLFGETSLVRSWGRIGSRGQQKIHVFDSEAKAVDLLLSPFAQEAVERLSGPAVIGIRVSHA